MASRGVLAGAVVTAILVLLGILFFVQTKDLMLLLFVTVASAMVWTVILVLQLARRGIPVRVVEDERKEPPQ